MRESSRLEKEALKKGYALRMSLHMRIQHAFFAMCVLVLTVTGLALYFSDTEFGRWLIELEGGFENRGLIHRIAAVGLMAATIYHLGFSLFSRSGSEEFRSRMVKRGDYRMFKQAVRFSYNLQSETPPVGKFTFGQKIHYWLAGIMTVTMIASGLALWNPTATMLVIPQSLMPVLLILHGYEGLLIFIVIVIWHIYDVHLSPRHFPGSSVWLTGRMPLEQVKRFHRGEYQRLTSLSEKDDE